MDKNYYTLYHQMEQQHWWFKARAAILESQVSAIAEKYNKPITILNIGVATGATTKMLEKFGNVISVEYDKDCCEFLKSNMGIEAINASMTALPFNNYTFDIVCAFDVIEHIEEDELAIREAYRVLNDKGTYIFTVPAFKFLWSDHDIVNHHFRRYTTTELLEKIKRNGLPVNYLSYFNAFLFLPIALVRLVTNLFKSNKNTEYKSDFETYQIKSFSNSVLYKIFLIERAIMKRRIRMPFGVSVFISGVKD